MISLSEVRSSLLRLTVLEEEPLPKFMSEWQVERWGRVRRLPYFESLLFTRLDLAEIRSVVGVRSLQLFTLISHEL